MIVLLIVLCLIALPVGAVEPDEVLDNPALEERARELSKGLRCPVCRNESIDESNADIAKDIRVLLRERLVAGDTDAEAVQFLVDRYGEFVLFKPSAEGVNLILYLAAPILLLLGGGVAYFHVRRSQRLETVAELSSEEQARLKQLLEE